MAVAVKVALEETAGVGKLAGTLASCFPGGVWHMLKKAGTVGEAAMAVLVGLEAKVEMAAICYS